MVILSIEIGILALVKPKTMVMALPNSGRKAKNPIQAPLPAMKRSALSRLFLHMQVFLYPFHLTHSAHTVVEHGTKHIADATVDNEGERL